MSHWTLIVTAPAERSLARLTERIAAAIVEFLVGPLSDSPTTVGKPLRGELSGYWSARRGSYRIVYRVDHEYQQIVVVRIEHRSDVYRTR